MQFLWNFLSDSAATQEWRLLLSYLVNEVPEEEALLEREREAVSRKDKRMAGMLRTLRFDEHMHQVGLTNTCIECCMCWRSPGPP